MHVAAGTKIHLILHLYTTDAPIAATSGIQVTTVPEAEVTDEAEFIFGGTTRSLLNSDGPSLFLSH